MLAAPVTLAEKLVEALRAEGVTTIVLCGASLGGFVTNLHHIHHDSADVYVPVLAVLAMDEAYLDSVYSRAVAPLNEQDVRLIRRLLNFERGFTCRGHENVFPLCMIGC